MKKGKLIIEKKEYGFRIIIGKESYFINDEGSGWFALIIEDKDGYAVDIVDDKYENLGAKNLNDLLCKLVLNPSEILDMLIGEKKDIEEIVILY